MKNEISTLLEREGLPGPKEEVRAVLSLAWPAIIEQIMITLVQYIDTAMVGSLGSTATAAIGICMSTIVMLEGFLMAASVGFSVQVAQFIGAKRLDDARDVTRQAVLFNIVFGLFMAAVAVLLSFRLPGWMGAAPDVAPQASAYFRIIGCSMPFLLTSNLLSAIIRCTGDTKTPMILNAFINVLNVMFNFLFIYETREISAFGTRFTMWGAGMGVSGAAMGSALSVFVVAMLLLLVLYRKNSPIRIHLGERYRFTKQCLLLTTRLGIPVALERTTLGVAQLTLTLIVSGLGTVAVATNHLGITAETLCFLPGFGIAAAATTLVGQAVGARRKDLAVRFARVSTWVGMVFMSITGILMFVFARELIMIFNQEPEVVELGSKILRIEAFCEPLFAAAIVVSGALRGAGDSKGPFLINLVSVWGVRLTAALLLSRSFGLVGVWIAVSFELCVRGTIFLVRLLRNKWLDSAVVAVEAAE